MHLMEPDRAGMAAHPPGSGKRPGDMGVQKIFIRGQEPHIGRSGTGTGQRHYQAPSGWRDQNGCRFFKKMKPVTAVTSGSGDRMGRW